MSDILGSIGVVSEMTAEESVKFPSSSTRSCNCASIRRYASMIHNPSEGEIRFIYLAFLIGWDNAEQFASIMGLKVERPIRALIEAETRKVAQ